MMAAWSYGTLLGAESWQSMVPRTEAAPPQTQYRFWMATGHQMAAPLLSRISQARWGSLIPPVGSNTPLNDLPVLSAPCFSSAVFCSDKAVCVVPFPNHRAARQKDHRCHWDDESVSIKRT